MTCLMDLNRDCRSCVVAFFQSDSHLWDSDFKSLRFLFNACPAFLRGVELNVLIVPNDAPNGHHLTWDMCSFDWRKPWKPSFQRSLEFFQREEAKGTRNICRFKDAVAMQKAGVILRKIRFHGTFSNFYASRSGEEKFKLTRGSQVIKISSTFLRDARDIVFSDTNEECGIHDLSLAFRDLPRLRELTLPIEIGDDASMRRFFARNSQVEVLQIPCCSGCKTLNFVS